MEYDFITMMSDWIRKNTKATVAVIFSSIGVISKCGYMHKSCGVTNLSVIMQAYRANEVLIHGNLMNLHSFCKLSAQSHNNKHICSARLLLAHGAVECASINEWTLIY